MPSSVPFESAADKSVNTFGIGTYDSPIMDSGDQGESNEKFTKKSLPNNGAPDAVGIGNEGYFNQTAISSDYSVFMDGDVDMLPGDYDSTSAGSSKAESHYDSVVHSVADSKLPHGKEPPAVMGYRDPSIMVSYDKFGEHGGDVFAEESLPDVEHNYAESDRLDTVSNPYSGMMVSDESDSIDLNLEGNTVGGQGSMLLSAVRVSTNLELVRDVATDFIKKNGKKGMTKRNVISFLRSVGSYSFLSSDVIRCLNQEHGMDVKDTLDNFPLRTAAQLNIRNGRINKLAIHLAAIENAFVEAEVNELKNPDLASSYRSISSALTQALSAYERSVDHG